MSSQAASVTASALPKPSGTLKMAATIAYFCFAAVVWPLFAAILLYFDWVYQKRDKTGVRDWVGAYVSLTFASFLAVWLWPSVWSYVPCAILYGLGLVVAALIAIFCVSIWYMTPEDSH